MAEVRCDFLIECGNILVNSSVYNINEIKEKKMKKFSLLTGITFLLLILFSACAPTNAAQNTNSQGPYTISAAGTGKVYLTPDIAYVSFGAHTEADTVSAALSQNNDQAQTLSKTLTDMGVDGKDIQTSAFSVSPQDKFDAQGQPTKTVYVVDNTVYVTVRDLSKLGKLLDAAVTSGANKVNSLSFDVQDKTKPLTEARQLAVQDAKAQAQELADAAGVKLGKLTSLNAIVNNNGVALYDVRAPQAAVSGGSVPVAAGQLLIQVDVNLSYEINQ
jgi:hypothetical protein